MSSQTAEDITLPNTYAIYRKQIQAKIDEHYNFAKGLKEQGLDPSLKVESPQALDLADRVAKLLDIPIAERLRELLHEPYSRTEQVALTLAREVALGKYELKPGQTREEVAIRLGLAVITDGVTVAPMQGVSAIRIRENLNGSKYISVEFAGPIRSAGGTESAFTLIIADQVRKVLSLEKYNADAFDDESGRFVEELRVYERDVGSFQYKISDQDLRKTIENLPVEVDGVSTDDYEVTIHRNMHRISTNKVRGGALRVLNDGVIGKSKKMIPLLKSLGIDEGWEWLKELSGGKQQGTDETKASSSHFDEVISGRPVLSMPEHLGGFRLRYGRGMNTGLHGVGIHPSVAAILNYPVVVGTQIKVDMPGKAASVAFVDTLETPIVRLKDGSVVKIKDVEHAQSLVYELDSILYLGDILISYGDFLENNVALAPSAYVEEWWALDFKEALEKRYTNKSSALPEIGINEEKIELLLSKALRVSPSFREAVRISKVLSIPLHPKYLYYWDQMSSQEILSLRDSIKVSNKDSSLSLQSATSKELKPILEKLGVEHSPLGENDIIITGEAARILLFCLGIDEEGNKVAVQMENWATSLDLVSSLSGAKIKRKSSTWVGVRVGRPEKAMERKMRPPVQGLFPVGRTEGLSRDIYSIAERSPIASLELANIECPKCGSKLTGAMCQICKLEAHEYFTCAKCQRRSEEPEAKCPRCGGQMKPSSVTAFPLKEELRKASSKLDYVPQKPLKGVLGLTNEQKIAERLEKVLLRQKYDLSVYRDGTVRYDGTNVPLTHFRPKQIETSIPKLKELGYTRDILGEPLENDDQILELFMQDIVIPYEAGTFLVSVTKFIDDLIVKHYGSPEPYYNINTPEELIGELIVGLAPHTSVGTVGRIIGFTNAQACFATPYWHSVKRRDCDGDGDSIILLMDVLLNFSRSFLPSIIGGLMDAPLLIQPLVLPKEVQRQAHHMDVCATYPLIFYEACEKRENPAQVSKYMDIVKDRLGTEKQYTGFAFTHDTSTITVKQSRSSYSTLITLQEKLDRQIELANKIRAVNPDEVVKSVLRTHLLPDIIGNTKAFTSQKFRCKNCGANCRRMPMRGVCLNCGSDLQPSVTRGSVEKYLQLGLRLSEKYNVGDYLRSRFILASEELATLFKPEGQQMDIVDYFGEPNVKTPREEVEQEEATESTLILPKTASIRTVMETENHLASSEQIEEKKHRRSRQVPKRQEEFQATLF